MLLGPQFWSNVSTTNQPLLWGALNLTYLSSSLDKAQNGTGWIGLDR